MSEPFDPTDRAVAQPVAHPVAHPVSAVPDPSAKERPATGPFMTEPSATGQSDDAPSRDVPGPSSARFARAVDALRSPDPLRRETGFDFLREHADAYIDDLVTAFESASESASASGAVARAAAVSEPDGSDAALRGLLLELICEARSPSALPVLVGLLASEDDDLRFWAARGLEMLDSRDARQALEQAEAEGLII